MTRTASALLLALGALLAAPERAAALSGRDSTAAAAPAPAPRPARTILLGYSTRFTGATGDGELNVWRGAVGGEIDGDMHLTVQMVGEPADGARPVWRVRASLLVATDAAKGESFTADLAGTIDWKAGTIRLRGAVTEGGAAMRGARLSVEGALRSYDAAGVIRVAVPARAAER